MDFYLKVKSGENKVELIKIIETSKKSGNLERLSQIIPYTNLLGVRFSIGKENRKKLVARLPFQEKNIGNPLIPALHGGAIGGFMEHAALIQLMWSLKPIRIPKTIDFSIDYLRSGQPQECFTDVIITRQGRRIAQCQITTWQDTRSKPIATARAHFLITQNNTDQNA